MSTRLLGRPTGTSPIVSARHSSFPRAWIPNEAGWEPRREVIPKLLLDRTALRNRQQPASLTRRLIARGHRRRSQPLGAQCHSAGMGGTLFRLTDQGTVRAILILIRIILSVWREQEAAAQ